MRVRQRRSRPDTGSSVPKLSRDGIAVGASAPHCNGVDPLNDDMQRAAPYYECCVCTNITALIELDAQRDLRSSLPARNVHHVQ